MNDFFSSSAPSTHVKHGSAAFDLPIRYFRDDMFSLFFSANMAAIRRLMPSKKLHPVSVGKGRAMLAVAAFNYLETSIGPYGEVAVAIPVVHGRRPLPLVPALLQGAYPGFGALVLHLPVTRTVARDAGRGEWGYPKFVADMRFTHTPEHHECVLGEAGQNILTLRVARHGHFARSTQSMVTYSVRQGELVETVIPQVGSLRWSLGCGGSSLELGDHAVSASLRDLGISKRPLMQRYFVERAGILPAGSVVESSVRPLGGYLGADREGDHQVFYETRRS